MPQNLAQMLPQMRSSQPKLALPRTGLNMCSDAARNQKSAAPSSIRSSTGLQRRFCSAVQRRDVTATELLQRGGPSKPKRFARVGHSASATGGQYYR